MSSQTTTTKIMTADHKAETAPIAERTRPHPEEIDVPLFTLLTTYISYAILIAVGHVRDFFGKRFRRGAYAYLMESDGYAPIISDFESLYTRRLYYRIRDCFNRPVTGVPGRTIKVLGRASSDYNRTFRMTGEVREVLNLSSYNYLGFAQSHGACADAVEAALNTYGPAGASTRLDSGTLDLHIEAEKLVARFLDQEASIIVSMGFATNSTIIPALVSKGCLIISDELNHASIVTGVRLSGAGIRVFKHNDVEDLELGQPRTHRPWKKILIIIEGLYSMEGEFADLPAIIALKKKYKCYLFLDEAHSIGALGARGRGICDFYGVNPSEVDILMGTFTKSFGAAGGYIAGKQAIIDHLRINSYAPVYAEAMPPPVLQQVVASMRMIMGEDGTDEGAEKLEALARNSRYFSSRLREMGFIVYGNANSPVVPMLLFHPAKIGAFSRECLKRNVAVVVVSYPATPIITSRVRFCLSAAHTIEDLDLALEKIR
ncbi:pyridoxal phosphate-dependent transferase [Syncephalis fuscata]|nr:pyridoxal phosphate-dependent transferase [Syncephalis fuscata]